MSARTSSFVATAVTLAKADEDWKVFLRRLDTLPVAVIALRLDRADDLTADMRAAADHWSLPLISGPADTALADVLTAILDALVAAQTRRLDRLVDIQERFTRIGLTTVSLPTLPRCCTTSWVSRSQRSTTAAGPRWSCTRRAMR
jgi:purine catabolism regulator